MNYLILANCCGDMLAVVIGRAAPLSLKLIRVGNNAVVIEVNKINYKLLLT